MCHAMQKYYQSSSTVHLLLVIKQDETGDRKKSLSIPVLLGSTFSFIHLMLTLLVSMFNSLCRSVCALSISWLAPF
jgi:hypothetical protein